MESRKFEVPEGAKQLTADGELYKVVLEEGDKNNRLSNRRNTLVGVIFQLYSKNGLIDENIDPPIGWITGYKEFENKLYAFLPIVVQTMAEGETCRVYLSSKYIFGNAIVVNLDGKVDNSNVFEATVFLLKAEPYIEGETQYNQLALPAPIPETNPQGSKTEAKVVVVEEKSDKEEKVSVDNKSNKETETKQKTTKTEEKSAAKQKDKTEEDKSIKEMRKVIEKAKKYKEEVNEMEKLISFRRRVFALIQLNIGYDILNQNRPAAARKEFNRARMAWGGQVDLSSVPDDFQDPRLEMTEDEFKNYILAEALVGVAKTFLAINPPNFEKASQSLREAIEAYPKNEEAKFILNDLTNGAPIKETKPAEEKKLEVDFNAEIDIENPTLIQQQFWATATCEFSYRIKFAEKCKEKGHELFKKCEYKNAMKYYNKARMPFTTSAYKGVDDENTKKSKEIICQCYNNCSLCYLYLGNPKNAIRTADIAIPIERKELPENDDIYLKSLYRKCLSYINLETFDDADEIMKEMRKFKNGKPLIAKLVDIKNRIIKEGQKDKDFVFMKMTGKA